MVEGLAQGAGVAHPVICLAAMGAFLKIAPERLRNPVMISSLAALLAMYVGYFFAFVVTPLDLDWSGRETTQIVGDPPWALMLFQGRK